MVKENQALSLKDFIERTRHEVACGNTDEAMKLARLMASSYPTNAHAQFFAGSIAFQMKEYKAAIEFLTQALLEKPYHTQAMEYFLFSLFLEQEREAFPSEVFTCFTQILTKPENLNSDLIVRVWVRLVLAHPVYGDIIQRVKSQDYDTFKSWWISQSIDDLVLISDDFITLGIALYIIPDVSVERALVYMRRCFLDCAIDGVQTEALLHYEKLTLALAQYCFNSDYLLDVSDEEQEKFDSLISSVNDGKAIDAFIIAVIAGYSSLYEHDQIIKMLCKTFSPVKGKKKLKNIIRQQIEEPKIEHTLVDDLSFLSQVNDDVSKKVRQQYEENPYPKWVLPKAVKADHMANQITGYTKEGAQILIAGCATGAYPINIARAYPKAQVSGIDLSLASLCYGKRKAVELKVNNLNLIHGDILNIDMYEHKFDVIETVGVLHHMEEPEKGLAALLGVLNKDGFIKIGLYSALARRHIIECQKIFVERGYTATPKGIRDGRKYILSLADDHPFKTFLKHNDFYNLSMMRDLLFHVQEHCYTIPKIQEMLDQAGLEFMGFPDIGLNEAIAAYQAQFPEDTKMTNLDNWYMFEQENPDTFIGMYKFWCKKII